MKINILGVNYKVIIGGIDVNKICGETDVYAKTIKVFEKKDFLKIENAIKDLDSLFKETMRHEIIHAYLYESGLSGCSNISNTWAINEEMVDWFAIQMPKIYETFKKAGCI